MSLKQVLAWLHGNRWRLWWGLAMGLVVWTWSRSSEPLQASVVASAGASEPIRSRQGSARQQQVDGVPAEVKRVDLLGAKRNPFKPHEMDGPKVVALVEPAERKIIAQDVLWEPPPLALPSPEVFSAVTQAAPAMEFVGRMRGPDGEQILYARIAGKDLRLRKGEMLPNGYRVGRMTDSEIELVPEDLHGERIYMDLPPPPRYEVR